MFIFDMTTTEIEYMLKIPGLVLKNRWEESDNDLQIVVDGETNVSSMEFDEKQDDTVQIEEDEDDEVAGPYMQKEGNRVKTRQVIELEAPALIRRHTTHPSFTMTVAPSAVRGKTFIMTIPAHHYREYLEGQAENQLVYLQSSTASADDYDDDGVLGIWPVNYSVNRARRCAYFTVGLKEFVLHHRIKAGDVCLFQLLRLPPRPLYEVTIFKK